VTRTIGQRRWMLGMCSCNKGLLCRAAAAASLAATVDFGATASCTTFERLSVHFGQLQFCSASCRARHNAFTGHCCLPSNACCHRKLMASKPPGVQQHDLQNKNQVHLLLCTCDQQATSPHPEQTLLKYLTCLPAHAPHPHHHHPG
jgi:hypothetical protein